MAEKQAKTASMDERSPTVYGITAVGGASQRPGNLVCQKEKNRGNGSVFKKKKKGGPQRSVVSVEVSTEVLAELGTSPLTRIKR